MSRDVITAGLIMRISLLYLSEYLQWCERFMNYLEEQTDGEAMIYSIQNGDHPLPVVAQVSLSGTAQNAIPTLKDPKFWTAEEKKTRKIYRLARSLLIQGLPNDIYCLIDSNETAKDLWDALERKMCGSEYGEQDRKAAILYKYDTFKATEVEQLIDTYLCYLQVINDLKKCSYKKDNCDVNDALGYKKKAVVITSDPLALVAEKMKVNKRKEKVEVQSESEGSDDEDISDLKKITALLAKAFNRKKYYAKPINNNLRTSSASSSTNKNPEYVKSVEKKANEKKRDMSKVKCYTCKKEGHFAKDCKKAKKDSEEQVLLAKNQAWMESSSDSDQEINANIVFMAQIEKVLSDSDESSSSAEATIVKEERYEYMIRYYALCDNDKKHRKMIDEQDILFDKMSLQLVKRNNNVLRLQEKILEKETKISELEGCVSSKDVEIEKCLERLNECENKLHKIKQTNQPIHMIIPSKDTLYNGQKGIDCPDLSLDHRFGMFKAYDGLSLEQQADIERNVSNKEIKSAVSDCGMNKSPGPDDLTSEFFRRYLKLLEHDIVATVKEFFTLGLFSGIPIDSSLTFSHLFFADDAIFVDVIREVTVLCTTGINLLDSTRKKSLEATCEFSIKSVCQLIDDSILLKEDVAT
nr:hypothetical protein [Tanacetum cinerariifolium]